MDKKNNSLETDHVTSRLWENKLSKLQKVFQQETTGKWRRIATMIKEKEYLYLIIVSPHEKQ